MIDLPWDGATTRVTLPARTYRGEGSDAGEMVVGKGGATRMVWAGDEPVDALVALPHRTGPSAGRDPQRQRFPVPDRSLGFVRRHGRQGAPADGYA